MSLIPDKEPPASFNYEQREYLKSMFRFAANSDDAVLQVPVLKFPPDKPVKGKLYYFTAAPGTPITIEGYYVFKSDNEWYSLADICTNGAWEDNIANLSASRSVGTGAPAYLAIGGAGGAQFPDMTTGPGTIILQTAHHIKHDAKQGSLYYPHIHFTNDTALVGGETIVFDMVVQSGQGHDQANFPAPPAAIQVTAAPVVGARNPWRHFIYESTTGISLPEVDSLVLVQTKINTATMPGKIAGLFVDLHYECERISTKSKAPDFYI